MLKEFRYLFKKPLAAHQAAELNKKIMYLSESIEDYSLIYKEDLCIGISITLESSEYESFIKYLAYILENDINDLRDITNKPLWYSPIRFDLNEDRTMHDLVESKLVHIHGDGQVSIKYPLSELFEFFDTILKRIAIDYFKAEQYIFPTLIKTSVLEKAGYFDSFPNLWTFVGRLHNDYDNYIGFKTDNDRLKPSNIAKRTHITNYSLPPTMCYYIYDMLSGNVIDDTAITTRGKSFRYENRYCKNMSRLWDFTIREIVFLGTREYVDSSLLKFRECFIVLLDKIGLSGKCVFANDPFYMTDNAAKRINVQIMKHSKIEIRLDTDNNASVAIASFNRHNQFISSHFKLYSNLMKENIYSGCIGFGLERLLFAFLCQYGIYDNNWPPIIKNNYMNTNKDVIAKNIVNECMGNL